MIRPSMTYTLAKNCFSCHLAPNEKLVNVGGHAAGSAFELVAWSQGEVRHNTWYNKGASNPAASTERQRMLFIIGRIAELETALIGVSKATQKADYAVKMGPSARTGRARSWRSSPSSCRKRRSFWKSPRSDWRRASSSTTRWN
ncbi:hypothetical protein [Breoghania sp.]|uniref:hypothetical protein n=1 Tax=Breoghania sp. TaxID=2065378 RepID=UPI002622D6E6|nr:hypothetical protein [Breoghania sp.]MDJ0932204.1 hypothetical protein [Breoghania sp.]